MPKPQTFLAFTKRFADMKKNRTRGGPRAENQSADRRENGSNRRENSTNPRLTVLVPIFYFFSLCSRLAIRVVLHFFVAAR